MNGVSIVICCHNSRGKLQPTLQHLLAQKTNGIPDEIIIVDNNSDDDTAAFAKDILGRATVPFQIIDESKPGLRFARERGIQSSRYDILIFCDDDNYLSDDYVHKVYAQFSADNSLALIGGMGTALSEVDLPEWFPDFQGLFAVGRPVTSAGPLQLGLGYVYGAGMAMRKSAWNKLANAGFQSASTDRQGKLLSGGHDVELSHAFRLIGEKVVFDDSLNFKHYIEPRRLTNEYLMALARGSAGSFVAFVYYLMFQRNVTTTHAFMWAYTKRVVSDFLTAYRTRDKVVAVMSKEACIFLLRNFFPAVTYFRQARHIYLNKNTKS